MARPRTPDHIKKAQGTLQPCRVNDNPVAGILLSIIPEVPDIIPDEGHGYFVHVCQSGLGIWLTADLVPTISRGAIFYAHFIRSLEAIEAVGGKPWQKSGTGWTQKSGEWTIMMDAHKLLLEFEREHGLTLASSQKISIPDRPTNEDDFDK